MRNTWAVLLIALGCASLRLEAQQNLLANPGFEAPALADGGPGGGWWVYSGQGETDAKVDATTVHAGKQSVRLRAQAQAKSVLVSPKFRVAPGDEIRWETWVRAEGLKPDRRTTHAGVAFRKEDGTVFQRASVEVALKEKEWLKVSGVVQAPAEAATAELHLGFTNFPATLWYDDAVAVIGNPVSFSLVQGAQPWPGPQEIVLLVVNRASQAFQGSVQATLGQQLKTVPVTVDASARREVKVPLSLSGVGAHNYKLSLLDPAGAVVRVLQGKFLTRPPLVLFPPCPAYHLAGEGTGDTRLDARINLSPAERAGLKLQVSVLSPDGQEITSATADAANGTIAGADFSVPVQTAAVFQVSARLVNARGRELGDATTDVRVAPRALSGVTIGPDGFLRIGGEVHLPIGMYSCGRFEDLARAGFTAVHSYAITTGEPGEAINDNEPRLKTLLDQAWTNQLRMMVELPRRAIEKAQWQQVRRRILTFRHHPGLLCWGSEERVARGEAPLTNISALYRLVRELDPDHPLVLGDTKTVISKLQGDRSDFFPDACMDVGIWWWYPIPLKPHAAEDLEPSDSRGPLLDPPSWLTTTISKKPLWIAIQSYQKPARDARFPTPAEYRSLAYLSIINGVKGLWFYTGYGEKNFAGKPAGLLNQPEAGHWGYVQKLVRELREFSPILMAPKSAVSLEMVPGTAPVEFTTRESSGATYLIAANKSTQPQRVTFRGDLLAGKQVQLLYEGKAGRAEGRALTLDFAPLGVQVYRLTKQ